MMNWMRWRPGWPVGLPPSRWPPRAEYSTYEPAGPGAAGIGVPVGGGVMAKARAARPAPAIVVGSGPNGLAAAGTLARAGLVGHVIGGAGTPGRGCRAQELTLARVHP